MGLAILHYDLKRADSPEVREAIQIARNIWGDRLRLEGRDYQPYANAADEAREG